MSTGSAQRRLSQTKKIPNPNSYILALDGEYSNVAFNEERAPLFKGKWKSEIFKVSQNIPLDLEIGTGNGYFFAHRALSEPNRNLVGIEIKYKPLIQSIRRAINNGSHNARIVRYNAAMLADLFAEDELSNIFIHHPDPWEKKKNYKHRLIQNESVDIFYSLQQKNCFLEFKTDSEDYFDWACDIFKKSKFNMVGFTRDLHKSEFAEKNYITHFERLFLQKGQPIFYTLLQK